MQPAVYLNCDTTDSVPARSLDFSLDGKQLVIVGDGPDIRFLEVDTGNVVRIIPTSSRYFTNSCFGSRYVAVSCKEQDHSHIVQLWDLSTGTLSREIYDLYEISGLALDPKERFLGVVCGTDYSKPCGTRVYSLSGELKVQLPGNGCGGTAHFSPDGKSFAAGGRFLQEPFKPQQLTIYTDDRFQCVRFSPDGIQLAFTHESNLGFMRLNDGSRRLCNTEHETKIRSIDFSPDSESLVFATNDIAVICSVSNGKQIRSLQHEAWLTSAVWQPLEGELIATSSLDGTIRLWEAATGQCRWVIENR